nr:hypothetical protein [Tanacetum cinerariifolium]
MKRGACKLLERLLGDVIEVLGWVLGFKMGKNGGKRVLDRDSIGSYVSSFTLGMQVTLHNEIKAKKVPYKKVVTVPILIEISSQDLVECRSDALQVTDTICRLFLVGASFTQGTIPNIPIGGSINPGGFLLPILLLVMIMVTIVIVAVILVVVVVMIVGVVIVVTIIGVVVVVTIIGFPLFATEVSLDPVFLLVLSVFAMVAAYASRATAIPSVLSCWMTARVMAGATDVDVLLEGILST